MLCYTTPPVSSYCCAFTGEPLPKLDGPQNIKQQQDHNKQDLSAVIKVQLPSANPASTNRKRSKNKWSGPIWTKPTSFLPPFSFCLSLHFSLFPFFSSPLLSPTLNPFREEFAFCFEFTPGAPVFPPLRYPGEISNYNNDNEWLIETNDK